MMFDMLRRLFFLVGVVVLASCGSDSTSDPAPPQPDTTTRFIFEPGSDLTDPEHFFDMPWPSDARMIDGHPDAAGFPSAPLASILDGLLEIAPLRRGWPAMPVAYFQFTGELASISVPTEYGAQPESPVLLIDVDDESPERGRLIPTVAQVLEEDPYAQRPTLAVAARPGFVLKPERTYAFVVRDELGDAEGAALGSSAAFDALKPGGGSSETELVELYAPLWSVLEGHGIAPGDVSAATVFTTGDVVADTAQMSDALLSRHEVTITGLQLDANDGADHERFCELHGSVKYPQFQRGTPPFETDGLFELGADGVPVQQGEETAPVVITIPKSEMPPGGYPLMVYIHGSGGESEQVVDRPNKGKGPAHVVGAFQIATAASALPVNPERLPGAESTAYLNLNNPKAFPFTFRQGAFEQRMFIEALRKLRIAPDVLAACQGPELPAGETDFRFAEDQLTGMGQSMGGMYVNMIAPLEPRMKAVVPTGAGGYWGYFILETSLIPGAATLLKLVVDTDATLTFLHPTMSLLTLAWEPAEPMVYMPRIARSPLPGHPVRPIYEPVGKGDSYFPTAVYDAVALAYGNEQAGDEVWPTMQEALALDGRQGIKGYPLSQNRTSPDGQPYTGVVVQYDGRGGNDTHNIAFEYDEVKYQYGCFLSSFLRDGVAVVPEPKPLTEPCP